MTTPVYINPDVGIRLSETDCPVCLALKKAFKTDQVEIYSTEIAFIKGKPYLLPNPVKLFIQRHDRGEVVVDFHTNMDGPICDH